MTDHVDYLFNNASLKDAIVNSTIDAVVIINKESVVVEWNDIAEEIFGYSKNEVIGVKISKLIIPEFYRDAHEKGMRHYFNTGQGPLLGKRLEIQASKKNGELITIELTISPAKVLDNTYFISFIRDLTETINLRKNQQLLIKELDHRVKNNLAIVQSLFTQTFRNEPDCKKAGKVFTQRVITLSKAHEFMFKSNWENLYLNSLTSSTLELYTQTYQNRITIKGSEFCLSPRASIGYVLALNELIINSVKYGSLSNHDGKVCITWSLTENTLNWRWIETNGPEVHEPSHSGFGLKLIQSSLSSELNSKCNVEFEKTGLIVSMKIEI